MIYDERQRFPYEVVSDAPCCGEIRRVRASLLDIIRAAKAYAVEHHLEENGYVVQGIAPL